MGKFSVTTHERSALDLEKTFSMEGTKSVLCQEKKDAINSRQHFSDETETLRKEHKINLHINVKSDEEDLAVKKEAPVALKLQEEVVSVPAISNEAMQMINALMHTQNHIVQELTEVFDKRLEKFDDIVLDLIRCKTENERLKQKVDNLTRDNYKYKKDIESFRSVIPGVYIKRELDKTKF